MEGHCSQTLVEEEGVEEKGEGTGDEEKEVGVGGEEKEVGVIEDKDWEIGTSGCPLLYPHYPT